MGTVFVFRGRSPLGEQETQNALARACSILHQADQIFSLYKPESPLSRLARGEASVAALPPVVSEIWDECERIEKLTDGWFKAFTPQNTFDPSGLVKTWAAAKAATHLKHVGIEDFTLNAGGDVLLSDGLTVEHDWRIGISKPVSIASQDAGVLAVFDLAGTDYRAVATSGSAERGTHIWNPKFESAQPNELLQVSVFAHDLVTADVWATASFAEGVRSIERLNKQQGIEALFVLADQSLAATDGLAALFAKNS
jgi:thiamine biosynthesis lipoprotein